MKALSFFLELVLLVFAAAVVFAVVVLAEGGCATAPPQPSGALQVAGLKRLYRVTDGVYRSEQPTGAQLAELQTRLGIKSVVKLNSALESHDATPPGVDLFHHPWLPAGPVDHEDVAAALWDLEQAPRPVLIHCEHGVDRTGLLVALWRVAHGALAVAAWNEWRAYGRDERLFLLSDAFERETGWAP